MVYLENTPDWPIVLINITLPINCYISRTYRIVLHCIVLHRMYCIVLHRIVLYCILSHALKNTASQRPGLPLHTLRYATGNMQRVICNGQYSTLLSRHSLRATFYWGPFEDFSKASSETFQLLRTITDISDHIRKLFPKIYEHFQRFTKIFQKF